MIVPGLGDCNNNSYRCLIMMCRKNIRNQTLRVLRLTLSLNSLYTFVHCKIVLRKITQFSNLFEYSSNSVFGGAFALRYTHTTCFIIADGPVDRIDFLQLHAISILTLTCHIALTLCRQ